VEPEEEVCDPFLASVEKLADIVMLNREEALVIEARQILADVYEAGRCG